MCVRSALCICDAHYAYVWICSCVFFIMFLNEELRPCTRCTHARIARVRGIFARKIAFANIPKLQICLIYKNATIIRKCGLRLTLDFK